MHNEILLTFIGVLIPFVGTTLGAGVVFFFKNAVSSKLQKVFNGFAARSNVCGIYLVINYTSN